MLYSIIAEATCVCINNYAVLNNFINLNYINFVKWILCNSISTTPVLHRIEMLHELGGWGGTEMNRVWVLTDVFHSRLWFLICNWDIGSKRAYFIHFAINVISSFLRTDLQVRFYFLVQQPNVPAKTSSISSHVLIMWLCHVTLFKVCCKNGDYHFVFCSSVARTGSDVIISIM